MAFLEANRGKIAGVVHMGAVSTTTETDIDAIVRNNIRLPIDLWTWCAAANVPLVYASSAATYGDGREGFLTGSTPTTWPGFGRSTPTGGARRLFDRRASSTRLQPGLRSRRTGWG